MKDTDSKSTPTPIEMAHATGQSSATRRSRLLGFAIGLVLIGAAVFALWGQQGVISSAWTSLESAPARMIALAALLPLVGIVLTSQTFWVLTSRYGKVTSREMLALLSSAWLLNYLPLWPGMVGRLAYHKTVNSIAVRDSAKALIWANVLNVLAALIFLLCTLGALALFDSASPAIALVTGLPIVATSGLAWHARRRPPSADPEVWRTLAALGIRIAEHHVWAGRFLATFALVGVPIPWGAACVVAGFTALAIAIPITGNSLGVREWVVGAIAWLMPTALVATTTLDLSAGLAADLVHRAIEIGVAIPIGLLSAAWLARRLRSKRSAQAAA